MGLFVDALYAFPVALRLFLIMLKRWIAFLISLFRLTFARPSRSVSVYMLPGRGNDGVPCLGLLQSTDLDGYHT